MVPVKRNPTISVQHARYLPAPCTKLQRLSCARLWPPRVPPLPPKTFASVAAVSRDDATACQAGGPGVNPRSICTCPELFYSKACAYTALSFRCTLYLHLLLLSRLRLRRLRLQRLLPLFLRLVADSRTDTPASSTSLLAGVNLPPTKVLVLTALGGALGASLRACLQVFTTATTTTATATATATANITWNFMAYMPGGVYC